MTRSASANAASTSPRCRCDCWATFGPPWTCSFSVGAMPEWASASLVSASVPSSATRGASYRIDSIGSTATGSTSYSTSIRAQASSAA